MQFSQDEQFFLSLLDKEYTWPDFYKFRFICSTNSKDILLEKIETILEVEKLSITPSAKEHYFSITFRRYTLVSDEVVEIYRLLSTVPGVIKI